MYLVELFQRPKRNIMPFESKSFEAMIENLPSNQIKEDLSEYDLKEYNQYDHILMANYKKLHAKRK